MRVEQETAPSGLRTSMETATVQSAGEHGCIVFGEAGIRVARQAYGCALQAQAGDKVLCLRDEQQNIYILQVLERSAKTPAVLSFEHDLVLQSRQGNVSVLAADCANIVAANRISVATDTIGLSARESLTQVESMTLSGNQLTSHVRRLRIFADSIDTVAQRLLQRFQNCLRFVTGLDQLDAGDKLETVHSLNASRARQTVLTAQEDARIDGKRIHIG